MDLLLSVILVGVNRICEDVVRVIMFRCLKRDDADKYAAAGHFAAPLIKELRAITALMLEDLPDYDNNPDLLHQTNVVPLRG